MSCLSCLSCLAFMIFGASTTWFLLFLIEKAFGKTTRLIFGAVVTVVIVYWLLQK